MSAARPASEVTVRVFNAAGVAGASTSLGGLLGESGYMLVEPGNAPELRDTTAVLFADGYDQEAAALAAAIGSPADGVEALADSSQIDAAGANLVVLLGTDLANG